MNQHDPLQGVEPALVTGLRPFGSHCSKCTVSNRGIRYVRGGELAHYGQVVVHEYLAATCRVCGYQWCEQTADTETTT